MSNQLLAPAMDLAAAYLARYPDVAQNRGFREDPFWHFQKYGQNEGRVWDATTAAPVDPAVQAAAAIPAFQAPGDIYGNSAESWGNYMTQARAQTEGMNRMPGVFSNYQGVPTDPKATNALFFADPAKVVANNPLLSAMVATPTAAPAPNSSSKKTATAMKRSGR